MRIKERNQSISVVVLCFFIGSCSSLSVLKFWGDEEEVELPAELQPIKQQITITKKWDKKLGEQDYFIFLQLVTCLPLKRVKGLLFGLGKLETKYQEP